MNDIFAVPPELMAILKKREGLRLHMYADTKGT